MSLYYLLKVNQFADQHIKDGIKGKFETTANLLAMGMNYQQIARATGLAVAKLEEKFKA